MGGWRFASCDERGRMRELQFLREDEESDEGDEESSEQEEERGAE